MQNAESQHENAQNDGIHAPRLSRLTRTGISAEKRQSRRTRLVIASTAIAASVLVVGSGVGIGLAAPSSLVTSSTIAPHTGPDVYDVLAKGQADLRAQNTISMATAVITTVQGKTDATPLVSSVASLSKYKALDAEAVVSLTKQTTTAAQNAQAAAAEADRVAAEQAAAAAAAQAAAAAAAQAAANSPDAARATARDMAASSYGWDGSQFSCLDQLWQKESGWSYTAYNADGGATGIPQALPGSKMASAGNDWATNAATQIAWGLGYIKGSYGTPCSAWSHSQAMNWY
ncbi:aggregation-promoting factor C-terminal-like domain-containing protein [Glaciibacter psychrotolerans]|uniref:Chemotaxis protein histidine kinase CheA n=1 Tax=Glaciibacter psychrotolerans TaxID=670054 RepID=A0A7Z0EG76_9MICO|nr:hypothetical protein [Leifsonia psychrotolerans]NYJ21087.1 chemotaxis protein histidine kinase CheA [Leifsonia psychrotolerans]